MFGNDLGPRRLHLALSGLFCRGLGGPSWIHWAPIPLLARSLQASSLSSPPVPLGWFGVIMIPTLFAATSVGVIAFIAARALLLVFGG